jgi:hypothetical protein
MTATNIALLVATVAFAILFLQPRLLRSQLWQATVGALGLRGGLDALERLTLGAVSIKLALIGALLTALLVATLIAMHTGTFDWPALQHARGTHELRMLLGLVILVQGFETSRYLGSAYDANTRVRTMRWAQWLSTAIYLTFMLLITRYFSGNLPAEGGETAIIDMLAPLGALVMPVIVIMALASQLSAAVADTSGAGGLIAESTSKRMPVNIGHLVTALAAIAITWLADIYQIITYASQAFVAYYALQSLQAMLSAWKLGRKWRAAIYAVGIVIALVVVVFAVPAEG